ncbi:PIN domain-containing protein [Candidatus Woesearchaeota archaeon]|nr:PIN domain-containing protein [Candidatus Woesearchaeota archaeon]
MKIFLDSSAIIFAFEIPESNSALVFDLVLEKKIDGVISPRVLMEVRKYFKEIRGKDFASLMDFILKSNFIIAANEGITGEMKKLEGKIKMKDAEQAAIVRKLNIPYLVAFDRDFKAISEYRTPKAFVQLYGLKPKRTEY